MVLLQNTYCVLYLRLPTILWNVSLVTVFSGHKVAAVNRGITVTRLEVYQEFTAVKIIGKRLELELDHV